MKVVGRAQQVSEVLDVLEKWVYDRATRSVILVSLRDTSAYRTNKAFRDAVDGVISEHARRHLNKGDK